MDELRRLNATSDSSEEPFGSPGDPFGPRTSKTSRASRNDRHIAGIRRLSIVCTAVGFAAAVLALLSNVIPFNLSAALLPGLVLIIVGFIAGIVAHRARPMPATVIRVVWLVAPSAGCLIGVIFTVIVLGDPANPGLPGLFVISLLALAGAGSLGAIVMATGAWLAILVMKRISGELSTRSEMVAVTVGSVVGGLAGFALLAWCRPNTSPTALVFVVVVTAATVVALTVRARVQANHPASEIAQPVE